jgi:4-amino-4-deoxy-L-arabinose transferase-like glycosyltransferase
VALPWYVLCAVRNPEFLGVFFLEHNLQRFLTPIFLHEQPFWFFGPILLLGLLPWSALLAGVARDTLVLWHERKLRDSRGFFFACWIIFPLVFFSMSRSKLPGYILPVFAPLVLLLARSLTRAIEQNDSFAQWLMEWTGVTLLLLAGVAGYRLSKMPTLMQAMPRTEMAVWVAAITIVGLIVSGLGWARKYRASLGLAAVLIAALIAAINLRVAPKIDRELSPRVLAQMLQAEAKPGEDVQTFHLHRAWHYGVNYYLHRELTEWKPTSWGTRPGVVATSDAGVRDLLAWQVKFRIVQRISPQAVIIRP